MGAIVLVVGVIGLGAVIGAIVVVAVLRKRSNTVGGPLNTGAGMHPHPQNMSYPPQQPGYPNAQPPYPPSANHGYPPHPAQSPQPPNPYSQQPPHQGQ
ncbi:hypothetical protein SCHAM137S_04551 [Streptomyces chartreusis]|nr:hypothetical protein SAMN05216482_6723 [Streptomyces sp. PAN_FS17]